MLLGVSNQRKLNRAG